MTITKQDVLTLNKKTARAEDIAKGTNTISYHRVHKNKKAYTRKPKHKTTY